MKCCALIITALTFSLYFIIPAHAGLISGSISVSGGFKPIDSTGNDVALDIATGIDFTPYGGSNGSFIVNDVSGDFSSIPSFLTGAITVGTIADFQFNPLAGPIDNFWTVEGFVFGLETITIKNQDETTLSLLGVGTISHAGFHDTPGNWILTANSSRTTFSWSAGTAATPEPGTLVLLGIGIAGIGLRYKRYRKT